MRSHIWEVLTYCICMILLFEFCSYPDDAKLASS